MIGVRPAILLNCNRSICIGLESYYPCIRGQVRTATGIGCRRERQARNGLRNRRVEQYVSPRDKRQSRKRLRAKLRCARCGPAVEGRRQRLRRIGDRNGINCGRDVRSVNLIPVIPRCRPRSEVSKAVRYDRIRSRRRSKRRVRIDRRESAARVYGVALLQGCAV